jgi:serine/threonine protein kinase
LIFKEMPKHNDDEDEEELASRELALWAEMGLHNQCIGAFNNERAVYRRLKDLQGKSIPRVVAEVELPDFYSTQYCSPDISSEIGRTLGLLTEYVDGFNLEDLGRPTERFKEPPAQGEHVQIITDRVLDIVRTIMSRGVLNCNSKLRNTLIRWDSVEKRYRPYVIDFGGCSLQEEFSTEEEWRSAQWEWTEEDKIGFCMEHLMREHRGGVYVYHQSAFARQLVVEMNEYINKECLRRQAQEEEQAKVEARV